MRCRGWGDVVLLWLAGLAVAVPAAADVPPAQITPATAPIAVDGVLDEAAWAGAWSAELPYEVDPGENLPAEVRTEVLVTHDADNLYVGFRAHDPDPSAIRAHLSERDSLGNDDWVGVVLDTFDDQRRDYLLLVNPYGVQVDRIEVTGADPVGWDGIWESAARLTDWGWAAELRVPFRSLSFQRSPGPQVWGFDAIRGYPRSTFKQMGAFPRDRNNNCYLCQAIRIAGFAGITPGRNLEVDPTLTATRTETRAELPDGRLEAGDVETEAGLSARWGMTPNLNLSGTVNPDFSQVEADALQLDVNQPFALQYEEKRPFFMEGADFFRTGLEVVYTRTIRDPAWGVKLTGKEGTHTVASYVVADETTNLVFPGSQTSSATSLDLETIDSVVRYKLDVGDRHTLGLIATDREGGSYFNRLVGVDGDLRLTDTDRVRVLALRSQTAYPEDVAVEFGQPTGTFDDWAVEAVYGRDTRHLDGYVHLRDIGPGFRADQGFIPMVGYSGGEAGASYDWLPHAGGWYSGLRLEGMVNTFDDADGRLLLRQGQVVFTYQGPLQSHASARVTRSREGFEGQQFDETELFLHGCMMLGSGNQLWLNLTSGDRIDYSSARPGERERVEPGFELRLGPHLLVSLNEVYERMTVDAGRLYTASIGRLTVALQLNTRCFLRAIAQQVDYDFAAALYPDGRDSRYERLTGQLLFSYTLNPRTVMFLGATDNRLGTDAFDPTTTDRTVFAKVGYAWTP